MLFLFILESHLTIVGQPADPCGCSSFTNIGTINTVTNLGSQTLTGCVRIMGTLAITQTTTWDSLRIRMTEGSEIRVDAELTITNSFLSGCGQMWRGIRVTPAGQLDIESNIIKDAEFGVLLENNTTFRCQYNQFRENFVGIAVGRPYEAPQPGITIFSNDVVLGNHFTCTGPLPDPYPGQFYDPGWPAVVDIPYNRTFAAVYLAGATGLNIGAYGLTGNERNVVDSARNGFIMINSSAHIAGNTITTLQGSISRAPEVPSKNQYGVFAYQSVVIADDNSFRGVKTGIVADECDFQAHRNTIVINPQLSSVARTVGIETTLPTRCSILNNVIDDASIGIHLYYGSVAFDISRNTITTDFEDEGSKGILVNVWKSPNLLMDRNTITLDSQVRSDGIKLMFTGLMEVSNNTIRIFNDNSDGESNTGISMEEFHTSEVSRNHILGSLIDMLTDNAGLRMNVTGINNLFCNDVMGYNEDFLISAMNPGNLLTANVFDDSDIGLQLNTPTFLGKQEHLGNRWEGQYASAFGAFISGSNELQTALNSQFFTDTTDAASGILLPDYGPLNIVGDWFKPQPGSTLTCEPPPPSPAPIATDLADLLVTDMGYDDFEEEMIWLSKAHIFKQILDHSSLMSNAVLDSFFNAEESTAFGMILALENQLHQSSYSSVQSKSTLTATITDLMEGIGVIDSILVNNPHNYQYLLANRDSLVLDLTDSVEVWGADMDKSHDDRTTKLNGIFDELDEISSAVHLEDALLFTLKSSIQEKLGNAISSSDLSVLLAIANECVWEGGPAVFYAQSLYSKLMDTTFSPNPLPCVIAEPLISGISSIEGLVSLKLYPNPNNGKFMFSYLQEGAHFQIWNSSGIPVLSGLAQKGDNYIDMISFPAGLYFILVSSNKGEKLSGKFIIQP